MRICLKELRTAAGLSQDQMAERLGVKTSRYGTWERGERMLSLAQAYECAVILQCSIDDIAGHSVKRAEHISKKANDIYACYESLNDAGKDTLMTVAKSLAKDDCNRVEKTGNVLKIKSLVLSETK